MATKADIRDAFDALTAATLAISPAIPVIYGNVENVSLSEGTSPFVKQRILFTSNSQMELGNRCARRKRGYISFAIYVRYDTGDLDRDLILERLEDAFRSREVGDATTLDAQVVGSMRAENWAVTALQVPFYYETTT